MIGNSADPIAELYTRLDQPVRWAECPHDEMRWALEAQRRHRRNELMLLIEDHDQQAKAMAAEWQLCAIDTQHAIENYVWIEDPHQTKRPHMREMPFVLWPAQIAAMHEIKAAIREGYDLAITKGRELGFSWLVQSVLYLELSFGQMFSARCASRVEASVDDFTSESLFGKFRFIHERMPEWLRPELERDKYLHIEGGQGSRLMGEGTTNGLARGKRSTVLFFDEYAHIEPRLQWRILPASESVASTRIWVSTPNGPGDHFAEMLDEKKIVEGRKILRMTWRDDPRKTEKWAAAKRDELGAELFEQEYEGKVTSTIAGKIWQVRRLKTQYDDSTQGFSPALRENAVIACGWDFGSGESLMACVWAIRENLDDGTCRLWVDAEQAWSRVAARDVAKEVHKLRSERYPSRRWENWGDPSGVTPDANQESWEQIYRSAGVPMQCLPWEWHDDEQREFGIKMVQAMIDDGKLMIHERCRYIWNVVDQWRRKVINNQEVDEMDRKYVAPKHDRLSHGGMALIYLVRGAWASHRMDLGDSTPPSPRGRLQGLPSDRSVARSSPQDVMRRARR